MSKSMEQVLQAVESKGYRAFRSGKYNVNIIGVRSSDIEVNEFGDELHLIYKGSSGWQHHIFKITTLAGLTGLVDPSNSKGCAILVEGQYRGAYKIRKHRGKYDALCQRKLVKVFRDNNKDEKHDFDPDTIDEGYFGINIHRSNPYRESTVVNNWSLGCQVFANPKEFEQFMAIMYKAKAIWGDSFTYTLINERDLG